MIALMDKPTTETDSDGKSYDYKREPFVSLLNNCIPFLSVQDLNLISSDIQKYVLSAEADKDAIEKSLFECYPNTQLVLSELRLIFHSLMQNFQDNGLIVEDKPLDPYEQKLLVHEIIRKLNYCLYQRLTCYIAGLDIDLITALSSTAYESKSPEGETIAILPSLEWLKEDPVAMFSPLDSVVLEQTQIRALRKQLNICGAGALAVYKDYSTGVYKTAGLISRDAALRFPRFQFQKHAEWVFAVNDSADIDVRGLRKKDGSRLHYCNGSLMLPLLNLHNAYKGKLGRLVPNQRKKDRLSYIINALNECKHGAILVIAHEKILRDELKRLPSKKRGTRLDPPILLKRHKTSALILQQLAAVDGAIFLGFDGKCHAFGVILDGEVKNNGNNARGSRYNSTKTYVEWIREEQYPNCTILGVVKSEDGMIDLFD